jgi:predicted transcriptional regulator
VETAIILKKPSGELGMMQTARWNAVACMLAMALLGAAGAVAAAPSPMEVVGRVQDAGQQVQEDPEGVAQDPAPVIEVLLDEEAPREEQPGAPIDDSEPGFADRVRDAFQGKVLVAGLATLVASALGLAGFALVTRYISPKEALKNPQRAMLYGFVRGNPGVHLKKLSEEFSMKTSSILWHVRKLENAELVRSERANGYRVFYPVDGGVEIKKVSRAITALQNGNARALYEAVERRAGATPLQLSQSLSIHGGTVRWHLRKLREFGLVEELVRAEGSTYYATPLGRRSLQTLLGVPAERAPVPAAALIPISVE